MIGNAEFKTQASFTFGILAEAEIDNYKKKGSEITVESNPSDPRSFSVNELQALITHDDLFQRSNKLIIDRKIKFFCDVSNMIFNLKIIQTQFPLQLTLVTEVEETSGDNRSLLYSAKLLPSGYKRMTGFKRMFEEELFCDLELKMSDGNELKAHKSILVGGSPVFEKMLEHVMKEANGSSVDIPDCDSVVMKELLRYVYCYEIQGLQKIAHKLVYAAEKYQLDDLKEICINEIVSAITVDNVLESLVIGDLFDKTGNLLRRCLILLTRYVI